MRRPALIRRSKPGIQSGIPFNLSAPVGGWNARDPLAAMPPQDAVVLDNIFPRSGYVQLRPGYVPWATGFTSAPKSLHAYNGGGTKKLFAATDAGVFDATAQAAIGASVATITEGYCHSVNFATAAGNYLVLVNGVDSLQLYDGATWAAITGVSVPAITGLATTALTSVTAAARRLWFTATGKSSVYYLPTAAIAGALTEFPLGQVYTRGGVTVAIGTWSVDGGDGADDYTVFVSSEGEVAVYRGTDPASSGTWGKVGVYYIGEPLGANCLCKFGGDLLLLCQNGLYPLSKAFQSSVLDRQQALTAKIDTAFTEAATLYSNNVGWQSIAFPQGSLLLANIPVGSGTYVQYAMNSITGAWCRFTGMNASCWEVYDNLLWFGGATAVYKAWTGSSDDSAAIVGSAQQAFNYFKSGARLKHFQLVRPVLTINNQISLSVRLVTDFALDIPSPYTTLSPLLGSVWETGLWDSAVWGPEEETRRDWMTVFARECFAASLLLQCSSTSATLKWSATDFVYKVGGVL